MVSKGTSDGTPHFEIPKECKAGVVVNAGPNFHVEVQMVPVPEPGMRPLPSHLYQHPTKSEQSPEYCS